MIRGYFFQDTVVNKTSDFVRKNKERDLDYDLAMELYKEEVIDILNPYENEDLYEYISLYKDDWEKFMKR